MRTDSLFDPIFSRLERVMDLRTEQHGYHSSNLANANTPQYRARSIDFSNLLESVMEANTSHLAMTNTHSSHLGGLSGVHAHPDVEVEECPAWAMDGNSVNPETEMVRMMENHLLYNSVARATARRINLLRLAISNNA